MSIDITRRSAIKVAAATLAAGGALGLAGCGGGSGGSGGGSGKVAAWPAQVPITGLPKPDIEGTENGVAPVFLSYPKDPVTTVKGKVGDGSDVRALVLTYSQPPVPLAQNAYWKFMNEKMNIKFTPEIVPAGDFSTKFPTIMAGGDLPDLIQVPVFLGLPKLPQLARAQWTDLSEYLSGDAVKDYPNIANLPTYAWKTARIDGRIIGVPITRAPFGNVLYQRLDILEKAGANPNPTNKEEFLAMCKAVTDRAAGRFALVGNATSMSVNWLDNIIDPMFGVPNGWKMDGGKLTSALETPQWMEALDFKKQLWDAGYFHPETPSLQMAKGADEFFAGTVAMRSDGLSWWTNNLPQHMDQKWGAMVPFSANGGKPINYQGNGAFSFTAIKKGLDPERVKMLLRVIDYCAAPFGSVEYFDRQFGVEGEDWKKGDNGEAVLTDKGKNERGINLHYVGASPAVLFSASPIKDALVAQNELQKKLEPMLLPNPTTGFYSATAQKSNTIALPVAAAATDYIMGRGNKDAVTSALKKWKSNGGDKIREEYEKAIADGS